MLKHNPQSIILLTLLVAAPAFAQAPTPTLSKLFTTQAERQLINSNRYKGDKSMAPVSTPSQTVELESIQELVKEEVQVVYRISGVSTNPEGAATAWVNGQPYVSGERMEDGSKVSVRATTVVITTPDGRSHRGLSGETLEITYERTATDS